MEKAKAAVSHFVSRSGKHETTVDEVVAPAVTQEVIKPTRHEEIQKAIDREVHQDHYHTTVQPVVDREIRPEAHLHKMAPVVERTFEHDQSAEVKARLEREAAQFKNTQTVAETKVTTAVAPTVEGEHVHHHVHETVVPVIHKEVITPEVIHTTVPIHEIHHAASQYHGTSVLPTKSLSEFTSTGGVLSGHKESHGQYDGCPRPYNADMQVGRTEADRDPHLGHDHAHHTHNVTGTTGTRPRRSSSVSSSDYEGKPRTGPHKSKVGNKLDPRVDSDLDGNRGVGHHAANADTTTKKPSLIDRLNPMKDTDRDGKKGIME